MSIGLKAVQGSSIEELVLENETEKSSNALLSRGWSPGWSNADKLLNEFLENHLIDYSKNGMKVEGSTTSLLSPYLHFGELSVRNVYQCVRMKLIQWSREENPDAAESVKFFLKSLGLREYSRYLCFNFPFTHERSLLGNLRHYPWRADEVQFKAWRQGRTGYPLVDAGMRELWATGWIHNRTRVIVSSFCVKFLLLPWTWGMKYFWDTLLDADLESDILGWQYISGSLPDGHQLDRLDSPEVQGWKFDPDGEYVRQWLPELARMPSEWIHHPWAAPISVLRAAGVELGLNYPKPIVEITTAREHLDDAIAMMWELVRATKAERRDGIGEVVADNLAGIKDLDIPQMVVKKEVTCTSSSNDQRVPSIQNLKTSFEPNRLKDLDHGKHNQTGIINSIVKSEKSKTDEDLCSTAGSSSARKRSISDSQCAAPTSCFSSSEGLHHGLEPPNPHTPIESMSTCLWQQICNSDGVGTEKEKVEGDAQSTADGLRPGKRPA
uniref:Cryptochrome-2 n=1 Tax=Anthurium amnicola TaxID=1678845 RepID=A0A1D1YSC7_9ARAE